MSNNVDVLSLIFVEFYLVMGSIWRILVNFHQRTISYWTVYKFYITFHFDSIVAYHWLTIRKRRRNVKLLEGRKQDSATRHIAFQKNGPQWNKYTSLNRKAVSLWTLTLLPFSYYFAYLKTKRRRRLLKRVVHKRPWEFVCTYVCVFNMRILCVLK